MPSIFSTQNLHTFLRRKNFRPPSRAPPPGPELGRPPARGPRGPPSRGAPSGRAVGASVIAAAPASGAAVLMDSSAMVLLVSYPPDVSVVVGCRPYGTRILELLLTQR